MTRVKCIDASKGLNIERNKLYEVEAEIKEGFTSFYKLKGVTGTKLKSRFIDVDPPLITLLTTEGTA